MMVMSEKFNCAEVLTRFLCLTPSWFRDACGVEQLASLIPSTLSNPLSMHFHDTCQVSPTHAARAASVRQKLIHILVSV